MLEVLLGVEYSDNKGLFVAPYSDFRNSEMRSTNINVDSRSRSITPKSVVLSTRPHQPSSDAYDGEFKIGGRARARDVQLVEIANMRSAHSGETDHAFQEDHAKK